MRDETDMGSEDKETMIPNMGKDKKSLRFSKIIVVCSVTAILLFFAAETYLLNEGLGSYPDVFVASWFSFWGVELFNLSRIKMNEDRLEKSVLNNPYKDLQGGISNSNGGEDEDRTNAVG